MARAHGEVRGPADPLGEVLHFLRMNGTFYCRSELTAPWALAVPPEKGEVGFQVVTAGRCWLEFEEAERVLLQAGDLTLVPHGGYRIASEPGLPARRIDELRCEHVSDRYGILRHGGGGAPTSLICGCVRFDHPAAHHLVTLLPRVIHVEASSSPLTDWIQSTVRFMA
ncbi:MAG: cupin domain-containing protein, partial [Gammaproteobacteria bacterium]